MRRVVVLWVLLPAVVSLGGPAQPLNSLVFSNQVPPVMAGPPQDPQSMGGQWFEEVHSLETDARPWEFHDHTAPTNAISGRVIAVAWVVPGGGPPVPGMAYDLTGFDVEVTISNDLPAVVPLLGSSNSHGEVQATNAVNYGGIMFDTRISAEFAISDVLHLPPLGTPYYQDPSGSYYIQAENETHRAWYCWSPAAPPENGPIGNFNIPTWEIGDIAPGESRTILMSFSIVDSAGNPTKMLFTDMRAGAIRASYWYGWDMCYNRYPSLKCSDWLESPICIDNGSASWMYLWQWNEQMEEWETEPIIRWSDVSVFFNSTPMGGPPALDIDIRIDTNSGHQVYADLIADVTTALPHDLQYADELSTNTLWSFFGTYMPTGTLPQQLIWSDVVTTNSTNRYYKVTTP